MTRSPLRWAGSKRGLLPAIRTMVPPRIGRYIEPFMGSACVYFDLLPDKAVLSDLNFELVQFFRQLRDHPESVADAFNAMDSSGDAYYELRAMVPADLDASVRAARFLYLNRFAFNGVYRTNRRGEFNVPRGVRTGAPPNTAELLEVSRLLRNVRIENHDYLQVTSEAQAGDFVYLDPPYRNTDRETYGEYGYGMFGSEGDVATLAQELRRLDQTGANVLLSFNDDGELLAAIEHWTIVRINRRRSVAGSATARTALAGEILAHNFAVVGNG